MTWDDADFYSNDPLVRHNAHQAAKGRPQLPDPDEIRKRQKEDGFDLAEETFERLLEHGDAFHDLHVKED